MQKITTVLWFNDKAEEAMNFYTSIFKNASVQHSRRYGKGEPGSQGTFLTGSFVIDGQEFMVLNGNAQSSFSPATSLFIKCETQQEVDELWARLSEGGQELQCGWVTDQFGVTWQVIPTVLEKLLWDKDAAKATRVMQAMMKMVKIDIAKLEQAAEEPATA
ncbi:VOC family protein [Paraflavisolibacter sp. H34]|uniref:VOC family protein n=1 Tax=Huijunlia imazamoxiresistens TaxID=3127457 RepID=UPI00301A5E73